MYAGRKVEEAPVEEIFARPLHPYTRGLLGSVPKLGSSLEDGGRGKLAEIPGLVPSLRQKIVGCPFAGRCPMATDLCRASPRRSRPKRRITWSPAITPRGGWRHELPTQAQGSSPSPCGRGLGGGAAGLKHPLIFSRDIKESSSRRAIPEGIVGPA